MPRTKKRERHPERLDRNEVKISEAHVQVDDNGKRWITASAVVEIWTYRARVEYEVSGTNYTRFSVRNRRADQRERYGEGRPKRVSEEEYALPSINTPFGHLYAEEESWTIPLHPRSVTRPDINKDLPQKGKKGRFTATS
jgi:hypothetical protein